jgi:hypothetical protein
MKKTLAALLAVASIAGPLSATPAKAHDGVGIGLAAGLLGGAIVGGAIAANRGPYPYYDGPAYYEAAPPPVPPGCYWQQQRYWDGFAWNIRPVRVCY